MSAEPAQVTRLGPAAGLAFYGTDLSAAGDESALGTVAGLSRPADTTVPVLALRIHGVGGAGPAENLATPATVQVAGDDRAGFHRAWFPGTRMPAACHEREAYCWGKLDYAGPLSAGWVLVLPFALVNLAHWMVPGTESRSARACRRLLRLLALIMTVQLMFSVEFVLGDLVGRQSFGPLDRWPSWALRWAGESQGPVMAVSLALVLPVLGVLWGASRLTGRRYEAWDGIPSTAEAPMAAEEQRPLASDESPATATAPTATAPDPTLPAPWRLGRPRLWSSAATLDRLRNAHMTAAFASVAAAAALPWSSAAASSSTTSSAPTRYGSEPITSGWLHAQLAVWCICGLLAATSVVLAMRGSSDRLSGAGTSPTPGRDRAGAAAVTVSFLVTAGALIALWSCRVPSTSTLRPARKGAGAGGPIPALPLLSHEDEAMWWLLCAGAIVAALVVLLCLFRLRRPGALWAGAGAGFAASLGGLIGALYSSALVLGTATALGHPVPPIAGTASRAGVPTQAALAAGQAAAGAGTGGSTSVPLTVPTLFFSGAMLPWVILVAALLVLAGHLPLWIWLGIERRRAVAGHYGLQPGNRPHSVRVAAGAWRSGAIADRIPGAVLWVTLLVAVVYAVLLMLDTPKLLKLREIPGKATLLGVEQGSAFLSIALGLLLARYVRGGLADTTSRRRLALFWDVVAFWPRAAHPFGPSCYAERVVPEVVTRIRQLTTEPEQPDATDRQRELDLGDDALLAAWQVDRGELMNAEVRKRVVRARSEPITSRVLLCGYSQGAPISVAVVAQLRPETREHVDLLTMAAPLRRLYGQVFPAFFGPDQLRHVQAALPGSDPGDQGPRWRNAVRQSDYVGGTVSQPARSAVNPAVYQGWERVYARFWARLQATSRAILPSAQVNDQAVSPGIDLVVDDPASLWPNAFPSGVPIHRHSSFFDDPQVVQIEESMAHQPTHVAAQSAAAG